MAPPAGVAASRPSTWRVSRRQVDELIDDLARHGGSGLLAVRDEVNRALETARQDKLIGTSLGARVTLAAGGEAGRCSREHEADLPMLFIVSQVALEPGVQRRSVDG